MLSGSRENWARAFGTTLTRVHELWEILLGCPRQHKQPGAGNIATLPVPVIELCTLAVRLKITVVRKPEARDLTWCPPNGRRSPFILFCL